MVEHDHDDAVARVRHVVAACAHLHARHHLQQSSRAGQPRPVHGMDARSVCAARWEGEEEEERGREDEVHRAHDRTHNQAGEHEGANEAHHGVAGGEEHCDGGYKTGISCVRCCPCSASASRSRRRGCLGARLCLAPRAQCSRPRLLPRSPSRWSCSPRRRWLPESRGSSSCNEQRLVVLLAVAIAVWTAAYARTSTPRLHSTCARAVSWRMQGRALPSKTSSRRGPGHKSAMIYAKCSVGDAEGQWTRVEAALLAACVCGTQR